MKKTKSRPSGPRLNKAMLIITLIGAIVAWLLCSLVYELLLIKVPGLLLIPMVTALFMLLIGAVVIIGSKLTRSFRSDVITGKLSGDRNFLYLLIGTLICFVVMIPLEMLYEITLTKKDPFTASTYIFLVDDSGSMSSSDPKEMRYSAITGIMQNKSPDTAFAVYAFADNVEVALPMQTVSAGIPTLTETQGGGTAMGTALTRIIDDVEAGTLGTLSNPIVVLITDGRSNDMYMGDAYDALLQRYVNAGIPISPVGLGNVDRRMLNYTAAFTGGNFVDIRHAGAFRGAVELAAEGASRDLLSFRSELQYSWLHGIMRVLFITIYAAMFTVMMLVCYGDARTSKFSLRWGIGKGFLAALILETGMNGLMLDEVGVALVSMVLIGTFIALRHDPDPKPEPDIRQAENDLDSLFDGPRQVGF